MVKKIELLSPAKDLTCGLEAIRHGADAVYIGAPKFGARAAAGNTLEDIRQLCNFAHIYDVRIYVTLNTVLKEEELESMGRLVNAFLDLAEDRAERHIPMTMEDWAKRLDLFLMADDREVLQDTGKITAEIAKAKAETEFEKYRVIQDRLFMSDFDKYMLELEENAKK